MKRFVYNAMFISAGMITAYIISCLMVYEADLKLYHAVKTASDAGYLTVPNQKVMPSLITLKPVFCGALFFTVTAGAFLSFLSFGFAWIWNKIFKRDQIVLVLISFLWLVSVICLNNKNGFCLTLTAFFLAVPPAVFIPAQKWITNDKPIQIISLIIPLIICIIVIFKYH